MALKKGMTVMQTGAEKSHLYREMKKAHGVKCPGSGEAESNRWENLESLRPVDEVKFVIAGREDYVWAAGQVRRRGLADRGTVLFSPAHGEIEPGELARWVLEDALPVRVQIQLHKVLWPGVERGV